MRTIIIYGTECDENTAWIPYVRKKLSGGGICLVPKFPTPENQNFQSWSEIAKNVKFYLQDVVVGWSTGAIFAVRFLFENNLKVKRLILVSGFNNYCGNVPFVDNINEKFFMKDLSVARGVAEEIVCIKSNNDPFITQEALDNFAKELNAKVVEIENGGHFNKAAGYEKFPLLVKIAKNGI